MRLRRLVSRRWTLGVLVVCVLLAVALWTVRPAPVLVWFGAAGLGNETPISLLRDWADDYLTPRTALGFLALFPVGELVLIVGLVVTMVVLLILFRAEWPDHRTLQWSTTPIHPFRRLLGLKVRTLLIVIAVIGVELGWEIGAWRNWQLREFYRTRAGDNAQHETWAKDSLRHVEAMRAALRASELGGVGAIPEARAAERAYEHDRLGREYEYYSALVAYHGERKRVYEAAASDTSLPIPPAPPAPAQPFDPPTRREIISLLVQKKYASALAGYTELIEHYPDLVEAHERRAWILATCPDAKLRDGQPAVASATRAAELTDWKNSYVLSTLAAAYAEAGDFASAVHWEEEVQKQYNALGDRARYDHERLALYKAGKPYHLRP
jgi:hypothetical protein